MKRFAFLFTGSPLLISAIRLIAGMTMEIDPRMPTHLWVEAKIRELSAQNIGVYVTQKGEKMGGLVLLKLSNCQGQCKLLTQQRDLEGILGWVDVFQQDIIEEKKADDYIQRSINRDPDQWVLEIEDIEMNNPFADYRLKT